MPSIVSIASPIDFSGVAYFQNMTDNIINIEIKSSTLQLDDLTSAEFTVSIPVFTNSEDNFCPLTYRLSTQA